MASKFIDFVNASPSPFHAVETAAKVLIASGYRQISEKNLDSWVDLFKPNSKLFFTRNQTTLFAFSVGGQYKPGNGFTIVGAHTDSPVLRVKPKSKKTQFGCEQVGVELYGGGLWNTWFDRDLSVAGRVIVENKDTKRFESRLVRIDRPILYIPNLAIHLNRDIYSKGFKPNHEDNLLPLIATTVKQQLWSKESKDNDKDDNSYNHNPILLDILAKELGVSLDSIKDFELSLFNTQPAVIGGALNEFIFSPRLDNLMMSYCSLEALINADKNIDKDSNIRVVTLFDHEEVGSSSAQGAASNMMHSILERIAGGSAVVKPAIRKSILISADMAHAIHPNYSSKHESNHRPEMHKGLVIKYNTKQRYATNSISAFILKEIAKRNGIDVQEFVVRNDMGCGSTIGPILASNTGVLTVDVGIPQLGMHSIREMCGVDDVESSIKLLSCVFKEFPSLFESLQVDEIRKV